MKNYRQTNGVFHGSLPEYHWLSPINKVLLTEQNASEYGYELATEYPQEYGVWLIESGTWLAEINQAYAQAVADMVRDTPDFERESWPKQEFEAKLYVLDNNSPTPYVDVLATARGIPRALLLTKILEKVALYEAAHAYLTGLRQAKEDALNALAELEAFTHEQVFAITLDFTLPEMPE